jgi:hypothetical protein
MWAVFVLLLNAFALLKGQAVNCNVNLPPDLCFIRCATKVSAIFSMR